MKYVVTTPVSTEPVTSLEATTHIVVPSDSSDATHIASLITAAREYCENLTGRALAAQTIKAYPDRFEYKMRLPREPINTVTSVKYTDYDGVVTTMAASNYSVDTVDGNIAFFELPDFEPTIINPIVIEYTAGYTAAPKLIKQAILLLVAYWYENRGDAPLPADVELRVQRMLNQYRVAWL